MKQIHGEKVGGIGVESQTRCAHYHSELDIIAIRFKCCGGWFPCFECHRETTEHLPEVWAMTERDEKAILCGGCGHQLTINEYFNCGAVCPNCERNFNLKCANHYELYFEIEAKTRV